MTAGGNLWTMLRGRLVPGLAMLVCALLAVPSHAETLKVGAPLCHAQSPLGLPDAGLGSLAFSCAGSPAGYDKASLWLRAAPERGRRWRSDVALMIHQSRFDRLAVAFTYADGTVHWQQVRQGDYGSHWRAGGQIVFEAPELSSRNA